MKYIEGVYAYKVILEWFLLYSDLYNMYAYTSMESASRFDLGADATLVPAPFEKQVHDSYNLVSQREVTDLNPSLSRYIPTRLPYYS